MSSTALVASITKAGLVPANRPQDHVQRIFTGAFFGFLLGAMVSILFYSNTMALIGYAIPFIGAFILAAVGYVTWLMVKRNDVDRSVPVVAKVLGTSETAAERRTRAGDVVCPVVVRPLEGADFRSIVLSSSGSKEPAKDLAPGTLMALRQVEPGIGDLAMAPATDEQRALMERWAKNPKLVSNRAPILVGRRTPLERKPFSSALEFYMAVGVGASIMFTLLQSV